jgi:hypothetical protein
VATVSRWEGSRLIIRYKVEPGREVRYTVSRKSSPSQLVVQVELVERGGRDIAVRIYEPEGPAAPAPAASAGRGAQEGPPVVPLPSQRPPAARAQQTPADSARPSFVPAVPGAAAPAGLDQRPGAEFKGLTSLGLVVEDLGQEAVSCGFQQDAIEAAAAKSLSGAGLKVVRNTDEDTYLYVHVITLATTTGYCISRYDVSLFSNTTATLTYGSRPVLVQASLLHKGGITGSGTKGHGDTVMRTIIQYVDQFAAQVRDANK